MTFAEDGVADRVSRRSHEICGQQVCINSLHLDILWTLKAHLEGLGNSILDSAPVQFGMVQFCPVFEILQSSAI